MKEVRLLSVYGVTAEKVVFKYVAWIICFANKLALDTDFIILFRECVAEALHWKC